MKNLLILLGVGILLFSVGCTDEVLLRKLDIEKNLGKEVQFFAEAGKLDKTRTYYGYQNAIKDNEGNITAYPIYWSSMDRVVIASPMGMEGRDNAPYSITVEKDENDDPQYGLGTHATAIVPVKEAGVQWGNVERGSFYSIYPYCAETLRRPNNLPSIPRYYNTIDLPTTSDGNVTATCKIENIQRIWNSPGTTYDSKNLLQMYGSNHALVMWAQTDNVVNGDPVVNLRYKPLSTCLMMTFSCDSPSTGKGYDAMIEKITINAPEPIAGNMQVIFPSADNVDGADQAPSQGTPTCNLVGEESNSIEIIPWIRSNDGLSGQHPTIEQGKSMQICAFLYPKPEGYTITDNWTIDVEINGMTYSRSLLPSNTTTETGETNENIVTLRPGEIHNMSFPPFVINKEWDYNPESWMSTLSNATYLTQITFPGAWYAFCQDQRSPEDYQSLTLEEQLDKGVRAFEFATRVSCGSSGSTPKYVALSGTTDRPTGAQYLRYGVGVKEAIKKIADYIGERTTETAVVVIDYEMGGTGGHRDADYQFWLKGLKQAYDSLGTSQKYIYQSKIDETTTLNQVRGNIILKINLCGAICKALDGNNSLYENNIPALFSFSPTEWLTTDLIVYDPESGKTEGEEDDGSTTEPTEPTDPSNPTSGNFSFTSLTSQLCWKTWNIDFNSQIVSNTPAVRPNIFAWNFSATNRTIDNSAETVSNNLPSYGTRKKTLGQLFDTAQEVYSLNYTNEWFEFGLGGVFATNETGGVTRGGNVLLAEQLNPWLLTKINSLYTTNKPCPLGIVFINQIGANTASYIKGGYEVAGNIIGGTNTTVTVQGDELLTQLIKMNGAFYLQQNPDYKDDEGGDDDDNNGDNNDTPRNVQSVSENHSSGVIKDANWEVI